MRCWRYPKAASSLLAPVVRDRKGEHLHVFEQMRAAGFIRVRVDGIVVDLDDVPHSTRRKNTVSMWWWTVSKCAMTSSCGWESLKQHWS